MEGKQRFEKGREQAGSMVGCLKRWGTGNLEPPYELWGDIFSGGTENFLYENSENESQIIKVIMIVIFTISHI